MTTYSFLDKSLELELIAAINVQATTFEACTQGPLKQATEHFRGRQWPEHQTLRIRGYQRNLDEGLRRESGEAIPDEEREDNNPENATENCNKEGRTDSNDRYKSWRTKCRRLRKCSITGWSEGRNRNAHDFYTASLE
jgi:hypothetical protein